MMKTMRRSLLYFIVWNIIIYLCFAFMLWKVDPSLWDESMRFSFIWFGPVTGIIIFGIGAFIDYMIKD